MALGTILAALQLITGAAPALGKLAERFLDGKATKEELEHEENRHALSAEVQLALAQIKLNTKEATHPSIFVAGWRPFVGWTSAIGFGVQVIVFPLVQFAFPEVPVPVLDTDLLYMTLGGLLGIGGLRTYEKSKGMHRDNLDTY